MSRFITLVLSFSLGFASSSHAQLKVGDKISEIIKAQDISFDLDLFSVNAGEHVSLKSETGLRVFPNKDLKTYSRVEPLGFSLSLGASLPVSVFYVGGQRATALKGEFIRQFPDQIEAFNLIKHPPYILSGDVVSAEKVPFTADRAQNLIEKDYFRYQIRTSMTFSGGVGAELGLVNLNLNKAYMIYGDLQIEVYKKSESKVLVRASSLKKKDKSLGISLNKNFVLELFEIGSLNKLANGLIPSELARVDLGNNSDGSLFAVEYEFDLTQESARNSYNQIMDFRRWSFWDLEKVVSGPKSSALTVLNINIAPVEEQIKLGLGDVQRIIKSSTHFSERSQGSSFNFKLITGKDKSQYIEQNISLVTNPITEDHRNYRIATVIDSKDIGGWLLFKSAQKEQRESNVLFELDQNFAIQKFLEMNYSYQRSDVTFSSSNQHDTAGNIYALIPGELHGPGVRDFVDVLKQYDDDEVIVTMNLSLEPRALVVVNRLTTQEIKTVVANYIEMIFQDQAIFQKSKRDYGEQNLSFGAQAQQNHDGGSKCSTQKERVECFKRNYRNDIKKMLELVPAVVQISAQKSFDTQWVNQTQLQTIGLYKKIGSGMMTRLLMAGVAKKSDDPEDFYRFAKLKLYIRGRKTDAYQYEKGRDDQMDYINELFKIRDRILKRDFDPIYFQ